ncbi:Flap endonuclease 1 [Mycena indigotica]|uniref:Flap endonuclease 1 n=1 Tax=Mycena indigotica TaxID=2126181 RepID=A0A8H6WBV7_9AGAR|nr:Flap endonuclease 1 [Mycena indigotica]KAF7312212.1 Flap endonuclease 1 [Mycena indigotica]
MSYPYQQQPPSQAYPQSYDPRQYPQSHFQPQPQQYSPYAHPQQYHTPQHPQQPYQHPHHHAQPLRPRSIGHTHSHSVPHHSYGNPPPIAPSAWQAQAVQAQAQAVQTQTQSRPAARPLPAPRRAETLPQGPANPIPVASRPLPTPTSSSIQSPIQRNGAKHHSIDLGRPSIPHEQRSHSPPRRRASPPRFTGGSGSWTDVPPQPAEPPPPISTISKSSDFKNLLSGPPPQIEGGKFVPLWKRGLANNGTASGSSSGRPLPTPSKTPAAPSAENGLKRGGSLHIRSPASAVTEKSPTPSPEPSDDDESESESGSEAETRTSVTESTRPDDSESDSGSESESITSPVSPSYGIRDLPRPPSMDTRATTSTLPQPPPMRNSAFEGRSAPAAMQNSGSSRTLMFAAAGLANHHGKPNGWPVGIPPLPRTPGSSNMKREIGDLEDSPPVSNMRRTSSSTSSATGLPSSPLKSPTFSSARPVPTLTFDPPSTPKSAVPSFTITSSSPPSVPIISLPDDSPPSVNIKINLPDDEGPSISIEEVDTKPKSTPEVYEVPGISFSGGLPSSSSASRVLPATAPNTRQLRGIACGGCNKYIVGRIVNAMRLRWHPECFVCCVCSENLEHVSSYERDGRAYCHLDYHEHFAPRCFSCKTPIVDERFISLDDPELGKRTYHEQHFFCSECGDPFLPPSQPAIKGELAFSGDGAFMSDDVGFTCKKCKRSIRDDDEAVEALGGKWCWACFCCTSCAKPFETPAFFERDGKPWCELCFSIILRNEV